MPVKYQYLVLFVLIFPVSACDNTGADFSAAEIVMSSPSSIGSNDESDLQKNMRDTQKQIMDEIGDARCGSSDQCAVISVGVKACGGTAKYLAYSKNTSDTERLQHLANRYNTLNREWNKTTGAISDCMLSPIPEVVCVEQRCALQDRKTTLPINSPQ